MYSLDFIWDQVKDIIRSSFEDSVVFMEFYNDTQLVDLTETEATVLVKYKVHYLVLNSIESSEIINRALKKVLSRDVRCRIVLEEEYKKSSHSLSKKELEDNILRDYTFENFVVGPSNKEAYMASLAVAMDPGRQTYNPLFIYGDSGLGKTHLLYSVGNYIKKKFPEKKILYISCINFVKQVGQAIKDKKIDELKDEWNSMDVLMVDDIQFLSGKTKSNEVFFSVYFELFNNRKQIILTSDRAPEQIKDIEERLVSRFSQGLSVTLTSPEYETAYKILQMKIKTTHGIDESTIDPEVLSFLATNFSSDVRKLEGSLNRLLFYSINFYNTNKINLDLLNEAFKDTMVPLPNKNELRIKDVINVVTDYYGLTKQQITGKTRTKNVSTARQIAMYLCRKHLDITYDKIGEEFGGKDHSTVISSCDKIEKLIKTDPSYSRALSEIENKLLK